MRPAKLHEGVLPSKYMLSIHRNGQAYGSKQQGRTFQIDREFKMITVLWFDSLKGIGEGFDLNGEIIFLNFYHQKFSKAFPRPGETVSLK
jgi:hypothetical protein